MAIAVVCAVSTCSARASVSLAVFLFGLGHLYRALVCSAPSESNLGGHRIGIDARIPGGSHTDDEQREPR